MSVSTTVKYPITVTKISNGQTVEATSAQLPPHTFVRVKLDFEEKPVFVNIIEDTYDKNSRLKKRFQPIEAACYSHSPPDMKLEDYNSKRHHQMFTKGVDRLRKKLEKIVQERKNADFEFLPINDGRRNSSRRSGA